MDADYVTFTSSSTVTQPDARSRRPFPRAGTGRLDRPGHQRDRPREAGLEVHVEAERHNPDGIVDALLADAAEQE